MNRNHLFTQTVAELWSRRERELDANGACYNLSKGVSVFHGNVACSKLEISCELVKWGNQHHFDFVNLQGLKDFGTCVLVAEKCVGLGRWHLF